MADAADLDAGAVEAQRFLQPALDGAVVALLLHVDEVDDDEAGEVAQLQLAGDLVGGLEVRVVRGFLDGELARRFAGVHVDGDQRFRLVDDEVAARAQRHVRAEHGVQLPLDLEAREERFRLLIGGDVLGMARHEHAHEVFGFAVRFAAGDDHLVDVLVIEVADRALDEVAFLVDEARRLALQGEVANALPQAQQVFEVALDLLLGARRAGRTDDEAHALRHFELGGDGLEALAVLRLRDLARDAAATGGVRHQDGVAAGERQVGGEGGALVAALFLDDLHQDHLAALDDLLDLVAARAAARARGQLFEGVLAGADLLDAFDLDRGGVGLDLTDAAVFAAAFG